MSTRDRIIDVAMRLFAEQGYAGTSIAQIEAGAGLAPGSGGLYKHFRSKEAVLDAGVRTRIEAPHDLNGMLEALDAAGDPRDALRAVAAAGLARLGSEGDLNRILVRDLAAFPELLEVFRDGELRRLHGMLTEAISRLAPDHPDPAALAAVAISAVSHHWLLGAIFGTDPLGLTDARFLDAVADAVAAAISPRPDQGEPQ